MDNSIDPAELKALTQRIVNSGVLGRSKTYAAILNYLVDCSIVGETPKEAAIAVDVLGREADFDVGKDSIVRVHIYHLRNKLNTYFAQHGNKEKYRLEIPKGQYLITTRLNEDLGAGAAEEEAPPGRRRSLGGQILDRGSLTPWLAGATVVLLVLNLFFAIGPDGADDDPLAETRALSPWRAIMNDDTPILLVVGDYFIFGELDEAGNVERMVREFDINSAEDLETLYMLDPELSESYYDLGLSYIPNGAASALMQIMPLLYDQGSRISLKLASRLNASDLTGNHVIYLGYISGLGILQDRMFAASGLQPGRTYDELLNPATGESYVSDSGIRNTRSEFRDYAMVSTFPSPRGHQFILVTGMRDAGLANAAQELSSAASLRDAAENPQGGAAGEGRAWEAVWEVYGFDHTNFDARLVYTHALEAERIWGQ